MGVTTKEFWGMTPFDLHIENQAFELKWKRENLIELRKLNAYLGVNGSKETINFDDILGYKQMKDYNFKVMTDFVKDGKFDKENYDKYLKEVVIPTRKKEGI